MPDVMSRSQEAQITQGIRALEPFLWPVWQRALVSLVLILHLIAVVIAPLSDPPPASELSRTIAGYFRPYLKLASLDNGYRFFAPDPGPSHLIRFELTKSDGKVVRGEFPKRGEQFPRLLYHRFFMLSETMFSMSAPTIEPPPANMLTETQRDELAKQQKLAKGLQEAVARYLLKQWNGKSVRLYFVIHGMPAPSDVINGMALTDSRLYQERYLGEFTAGNN